MQQRHDPVEPDTTTAVGTPPEQTTEGQPSSTGDAPRGKRRWRRIALISFLVVALLGGAGTIAGALYLRSVESDIDRLDAFVGVPQESRPQVVAKDAMNIMILGSDSRDPDSSSGSRTDTIILAHLPADRSSAQLISIPRDTWVSVPRSAEGRGGRDAKINAAYAWGGVPLMVQTVEQFTKVRVDHVVMVDFAGFKEIIDALGGIEVNSEKQFTSIHPPFRTFQAGPQKMDGEAALDYSRQRKQFADGDFSRIRHQQQVIKAIMDKATSGGLLTNPARLNSFLQATSGSLSMDNDLSLVDMATENRNLRGRNLTFVTSPTKGTGRVGSESVVFADDKRVDTFYAAVRRDSVQDIIDGADNK
ncbi:LCP family protein [Micromonospora craniellae]|uniref:LytR family transcriptional regulator n=1 Tax=Micromonospora craniellae TaxID=2294034 RepID=A0A372FXR8_9ACTN|nr:LCP family protein [Micromonospora craniellae]QOC93245.1 LCP family protein [Micromonospora craniellae]RFS45414.1 LytR family transcriptional regulator [Micromonospora craniellae]